MKKELFIEYILNQLIRMKYLADVVGFKYEPSFVLPDCNEIKTGIGGSVL